MCVCACVRVCMCARPSMCIWYVLRCVMSCGRGPEIDFVSASPWGRLRYRFPYMRKLITRQNDGIEPANYNALVNGLNPCSSRTLHVKHDIWVRGDTWKGELVVHGPIQPGKCPRIHCVLFLNGMITVTLALKTRKVFLRKETITLLVLGLEMITSKAHIS